MYDLLKSFIEKNGLLHEAQYGFREKSSTQNAILDIVNAIQSNLDKKMFACGIFIYLKKAFDTVDHWETFNRSSSIHDHQLWATTMLANRDWAYGWSLLPTLERDQVMELSSSWLPHAYKNATRKTNQDISVYSTRKWGCLYWRLLINNKIE